MQRQISEDLRRAGIAASTIREALAPWVEQETQRLIVELAQAPANLEALLKIKADATAFFQLKRQLELAMNRGGVEPS